MATGQSTAIYKLVPAFTTYRVGDDGSIWSRYAPGLRGAIGEKWHALNPSPNKSGHLVVGLSTSKKEKTYLLHRLILEAFVGPCPVGQEGCHFDRNPANNALSNLRWDTRESNVADAIRHGTKPRGEKHANAKLTEAQVRAMRVDRASGSSLSSLAGKYGVSYRTVWRIIHRLRWAHVI